MEKGETVSVKYYGQMVNAVIVDIVYGDNGCYSHPYKVHIHKPNGNDRRKLRAYKNVYPRLINNTTDFIDQD